MYVLIQEWEIYSYKALHFIGFINCILDVMIEGEATIKYH